MISGKFDGIDKCKESNSSFNLIHNLALVLTAVKGILAEIDTNTDAPKIPKIAVAKPEVSSKFPLLLFLQKHFKTKIKVNSFPTKSCSHILTERRHYIEFTSSTRKSYESG